MAAPDAIKWESLNHSELIALARWNDLPASRGHSREELIQSLQTLTPLEKHNQFDAMRTSMSNWLVRWWDKVRMQVPKKVCPNCFECRDIQILSCYSKNEASIKSQS